VNDSCFLSEDWRALIAPYRHASDAGEVGQTLLASRAEPRRCCHNIEHLRDVLVRVDELAAHAADPDRVRLAAWPPRRLEHRRPHRASDGRAPLPAARRERHKPLRRRTTAGCAVSIVVGRPDLLLLDEPTNHLDAESGNGSNNTSTATPERWSPPPTTATSSTMSRSRSSDSTAATPTHTGGTTPPTLKPKPPGSRWRVAATPNAYDTCRPNSTGCGAE
jgi:hypothetical protein